MSINLKYFAPSFAYPPKGTIEARSTRGPSTQYDTTGCAKLMGTFYSNLQYNAAATQPGSRHAVRPKSNIHVAINDFGLVLEQILRPGVKRPETAMIGRQAIRQQKQFDTSWLQSLL